MPSGALDGHDPTRSRAHRTCHPGTERFGVLATIPGAAGGSISEADLAEWIRAHLPAWVE